MATDVRGGSGTFVAYAISMTNSGLVARDCTTSERRTDVRHSVPLECAWNGASGFSLTRISDLSLTGCYVDSSQVPAEGETVEITLALNDVTQVLTGEVVHARVGMGFAVRFGNLSDSTQGSLKAFLAEH